MSSSMKMFKKFFKRTKNKRDAKDSVKCDSVPIKGAQENLPVAIPIPNDSLHGRRAHSRALDVTNQVTNSSAVDVYNEHNSLTSISSNSLPASGRSSATPYIQLSVNNSHGFHIGDVQNVHVSNGSVVNINSSTSGSGLSNLEKSLGSLKTTDDDNTLESLKDYTKIKDWEISLISEYVGDDWKNVGNHLGMESNDLAVIQQNNNNEPKESTLQMFNVYLKAFPDTSYGFILHILQKTGQTKAAKQLMKIRS